MGKRCRVRLERRRRVRLIRRERVKLEWKAKWDGAVRGYAMNYIRKNLWRCDPMLEFEDLMQDAFEVFLIVSERYPRVVEDRHFMALFKRALANKVCDKSRYATAQRAVLTGINPDEAEKISCNPAEDGAMVFLLATAPPEARLVLSALSSDSNLQKLRQTYSRRSELPRDNLNAKVKKLLGINNEVDLIGPLREWLTV